MIGFPGHPADSGVGESVGSCNLVGKESTYFTRSLGPVVVLGISRKVIMKLKKFCSSIYYRPEEDDQPHDPDEIFQTFFYKTFLQKKL
jgi:hypothetical protein